MRAGEVKVKLHRGAKTDKREMRWMDGWMEGRKDR